MGYIRVISPTNPITFYPNKPWMLNKSKTTNGRRILKSSALHPQKDVVFNEDMGLRDTWNLRASESWKVIDYPGSCMKPNLETKNSETFQTGLSCGVEFSTIIWANVDHRWLLYFSHPNKMGPDSPYEWNDFTPINFQSYIHFPVFLITPLSVGVISPYIYIYTWFLCQADTSPVSQIRAPPSTQ